LCRALSWTSRATWDLITEQLDQVLNGPQSRMIDERAVTDVAMTVVRRMSPGTADVVVFTQGQEAITGADFELLVFDGAGHYVAYLVQAKAIKADGSKEGYPALGKRNGKQFQYEKLLEACGPGTPWTGHGALHVFYNGELLKSKADWPNDRCQQESAADQAARGITVAPTADIAAAVAARRRSYRYDRIAPVCWPWWCFFCCTRQGLGDLARRSGGRSRGEQSDEPTGRDDRPSGGASQPIIREVGEAPLYVRLAGSGDGGRRVVELPAEAQPPAAATVVALTLN